MNELMIDTGAEYSDVEHDLAKQLLANLKAAQALEAAAKASVAAAKAAVLEVMAGADILRDALTEQELVVNRAVVSNVFDSTRFRKEHPALAVSYMKTQTSRPFKVVA